MMLLRRFKGGRTVVLTVILLGMLSSVGCGPPSGRTGGRLDPYSTPKAPGDKASMAALLEFCDSTAQSLALSLSEIPEVKAAKTRLVLELGNIKNRTRTRTTDFELIQNRLRGQLCQSKLITDNFLVVISSRRMDGELERIQGPKEDLLQEGTGGAKTSRYDPKITYVLLGDFYEARRSGMTTYLFQFTLTNLARRAIVFQKSFDHAQKR